MDPSPSALMERLVVIREMGKPVPQDMVGPLIAVLAQLLADEVRRANRDREIRMAALHVAAANDSDWVKAGKLADQVALLDRARRCSGNLALLHLSRARDFGDLPGSQKQLWRILAAANDGAPPGGRAADI